MDFAIRNCIVLRVPRLLRALRTRAAAQLIAAHLIAAVMSSTFPLATAAHANAFSPVSGGAVRALLIGIDDYRFVPKLQGAVADARDLQATLRGNGVTDITALIDSASDRASILRALDDLLNRSRAGDLVILSIAGHGVQEPEHVKGSQPDGMDNVFILAGFSPDNATAAGERILGTEFNHVIKAFEAKGARVLFVADACHGGGLSREVDARASELRYREIPRYTLKADSLTSLATTRDAYLSESDFQHTTFLAAVNRATKAPEVRIPGVDGFRGALSYALARALEGAADANSDGRITQTELFDYVRQIAYQLSDQRQHVEASGPMTEDAGFDVAYARTRAVVLLDTPEKSEPRPQPQITPTTPTAITPSAKLTTPPATPSPQPPKATTPLESVRIAVLGNQRELLKDIQTREARFETVGVADNPDLLWDPTTLDVLAGADVVARGIERADLPGVIDRLAAVKGFKRLSAAAPQTLRVLPNDKVQRRDTRIEVQVSGVAQRSLLLFNIAGDGTVQALYPIGSDQPVIATADYKFPLVVSEPFGAEQLIAITSSQRLGDLEQALKKMTQRKTAVEVYKLVERYAPPDAKIGVTNLYTAP